MAKAICAKCGQEFPSESAYQKHKDSGHVLIGTPLDPTIPIIAEQSKPSQEFIETVKRIENKANEEKKIENAEKSEAVTDSNAPKKPLELKYVYTGHCSDHSVEVDTVVVEADDKYFAIAICPVDKKQLITKKVAKL